MKITEKVKQKVSLAIRQFNKENDCQYQERYRGEFLYLDKADAYGLGHVCRLKFNGASNNWSFAIYKYSDEKYDSEEEFFPGEELVNGTLDGAMKAGLLAYPPVY